MKIIFVAVQTWTIKQFSSLKCDFQFLACIWVLAHSPEKGVLAQHEMASLSQIQI